MDRPPDTARTRIVSTFRFVEQALYLGVAVALAVGGLMLFGVVVRRFALAVHGGRGVSEGIIQLLEGVLLVFILAELIHTIRAVIDENVLRTEPFLIVGIVAAIRRLVVITADAERHVGEPVFRDLLLEMTVLSGAVLVLGATIYLVRHTSRSEPLPAHEEAKART
jgi:uncharacterized membrane protein (DUF373 family)